MYNFHFKGLYILDAVYKKNWWNMNFNTWNIKKKKNQLHNYLPYVKVPQYN